MPSECCHWNATAGERLVGHAIGQGLAQALGLSKHGVKQVDRLLSNQGIDVWEFFGYWVPYLVGARQWWWRWIAFARDQQDTVVVDVDRSWTCDAAEDGEVVD